MAARRREEGAEEADEVDLFAWITLAPKNFRISASLSRWAKETDSKVARDRGSEETRVVVWRSGYLEWKNEEDC